jgi:hypothetical protein
MDPLGKYGRKGAVEKQASEFTLEVTRRKSIKLRFRIIRIGEGTQDVKLNFNEVDASVNTI